MDDIGFCIFAVIVFFLGLLVIGAISAALCYPIESIACRQEGQALGLPSELYFMSNQCIITLPDGTKIDYDHYLINKPQVNK